MTGVPKFDPTQPFEVEKGSDETAPASPEAVASNSAIVPKFDPTKPFEPETPSREAPAEAPSSQAPRQPVNPAAALRDAPVSSGMVGVMRGLTDLPDAGAQLLTRGLEAVAPAGSDFETWAKGQRENVEKLNAEREEEYRKTNPKTTFDLPRIVGSVAGMGPITGAVKTVATLVARALAGAKIGAASGALQPVESDKADDDFWKEKAKQIAIGTGTGAALPAAAGAVARVISPNASVDPAIQALKAEGVRLSPGQIAGEPFKRLENGATSIPVVGDLVRSTQRRGIEDLNRAAYNRVLEPLVETMPQDIKVGRDSIQHLQDRVSGAYDDLLPKLKVGIDPEFIQDATNLHAMAAGMEEKMAKQFSNIFQTKVADKLAPNGRMDGETLKAMESELGQLSKSYRTSSLASERELGNAVGELQGIVRDLVTRENPLYADRLQAINKAYGNLAIVERAAGGSGATDGVFSPAQLSGAVKASDPTVRDRAFAAGRARMQDLSDPAKAVMPSSVPDSGSPYRLMTAAGLTGGAGMVEPTAAATAAALSSIYTRPGRALFSGAMSSRPAGAQNLAQTLREGSRLLGGGAAPIGYGALSGLLK